MGSSLSRFHKPEEVPPEDEPPLESWSLSRESARRQVVVVRDSRLSESSRERLSGEGLGVDGSGGQIYRHGCVNGCHLVAGELFVVPKHA